MDSELYNSLIRGDVETALRAVCRCLLEERWAVLEETWVRLLGWMGERLNRPEQGVVFYRMVSELHAFIHQDDLAVKDALLYTAKLFLIFQRPFLRAHTGVGRPNLQKLRSRVISYFPLDAQLTHSGRTKFQGLLPKDPEEAAFAERILVGLLQLCESSADPMDLKGALEYLARKKLVLYSAPDADEPEDLVPYLWTVMKHLKPLSFYDKLSGLYYYAYKPSLKNTRLGFLFAFAYLSESSATSVEAPWSPTEQVLLNKIAENTRDLWKEAKEHAGKTGPKTEGAIELPMFVPIRAPEINTEPSMKPIKQKTVHITRGKGRNKLIQRYNRPETAPLHTDISLTDDEETDERMREIQLKDNRKKNKDKANESSSHRDSSGHWGFHFDKTGARI